MAAQSIRVQSGAVQNAGQGGHAAHAPSPSQTAVLNEIFV